MADTRVRHQLFVGQTITRISRRGGPLQRNLELRGIAVQAQAKQRIRQSPRRIDTGNLLNSIQIVTLFRDGMPVVRVGTNVEYAIYVHEGTIYMEPNPFLRDGLIRGMRQFR